MNPRTARRVLRGGALALAALALLAAWAYGAGCLYFLFNRAMPRHVGTGTWYLYWQAYGGDGGQRLRLLAAAALPALPLLAGVALALKGRQRPLYGDARWATEQEIRDARLL